MKTQEELFYDIILLAQNVDNLKGWVQNDFDRNIEKLSTLKVAVYNHIKNVAIKL